MQTLATILRKRLDDAKKIAVLGIGSELRADDAAGLLVAKQIRMSFPQSQRVKIFLGHTAPENLISQIKKFKPLHLIIIDALDMAKRPGGQVLLPRTEPRSWHHCSLLDWITSDLDVVYVPAGVGH